MAAAATDKLIKGAENWQSSLSSNILISDTTIPLTSVVGLPTDTAVEITIDRVNSSSVLTPTKKEVIRGVVSGSNIISSVRGVEGTQQAHASGAIVEVRLTASQWNEMMDFLLVSFNQSGTFKNVPTYEAFTPAGAGTTTITPTTAKVNKITMPAATQTIAISGEVANQVFIIDIQNSTSQGALTWFDTIRWTDGVVPTLTGTNGKIDSFGFRVLAADSYLGYVIGQNL